MVNSRDFCSSPRNNVYLVNFVLTLKIERFSIICLQYKIVFYESWLYVCQLCAWGSNSLIGPRKGYTGYECVVSLLELEEKRQNKRHTQVVPIISYKITCFFYLDEDVILPKEQEMLICTRTIFCLEMPQKIVSLLCKSLV